MRRRSDSLVDIKQKTLEPQQDAKDDEATDMYTFEETFHKTDVVSVRNSSEDINKRCSKIESQFSEFLRKFETLENKLK